MTSVTKSNSAGKRHSSHVRRLGERGTMELLKGGVGARCRHRIRQVKMLATPDELEALLRDAGLRRRAAAAVAARGFSGLTKSAPPEIDADRVADVLRQQALELKNWK
jgi:hypothetical protein